MENTSLLRFIDVEGLPLAVGLLIVGLIGLRVTNEEEIEGLDINLHGETVH